jgi:hypothetical protein
MRFSRNEPDESGYHERRSRPSRGGVLVDVIAIVHVVVFQQIGVRVRDADLRRFARI